MLRVNLLHILRTNMRIAPLLGIILIGAFLASGCATTREDDYVASILKEAMRESGVQEASLAGMMPESAPATHLAVTGPSVVSVTPAGVVSASAGGSVPTVQASASTVMVKPQPAVVSPVVIPVQTPAIAAVTVPVARPTPVAGSGVAANPMVTTLAATGDVTVTTSTSLTPGEPTIQPDTVLWVSVTEDPSLNGRYVVNNSSAIDFGYVGLVFLQDMTATQAETAIKNVLIGRYLNHATVTVKIAKASYDVVGVLGSVEVPGEIKIGPGSAITLSDALRRANGLRSNRESNRIKIIRGGLRNPFGPAAEGEVFSLVGEDGQLRVPAVYLRNNDLVYVFSAAAPAADGVVSTGAGGKRVVLLGEVPRRGVVEFAENEPCTLMYLLFKIGGLPRFAKGDRIQIVRTQKDGSEKTFIVDGETLMKNGDPRDDVVLESGDRIVVPERKLSFF
jgi:protein involved in polysaccharide export with SLBB domain